MGFEAASSETLDHWSSHFTSACSLVRRIIPVLCASFSAGLHDCRGRDGSSALNLSAIISPLQVWSDGRCSVAAKTLARCKKSRITRSSTLS